MIKKLTEQITSNSTITIAIKKTSDTEATVMVNVKDVNRMYPPIVISGNIDEIERNLFNIINEPLKKSSELVVQKEEFENSVKEAEKDLKEKKSRKTVTKSDHNEVLTEDSPKDDKSIAKEIKSLENMMIKKHYIEVKIAATKLLEKAKEVGNIEKIKTMIDKCVEILSLATTNEELPVSQNVSTENPKQKDAFEDISVDETNSEEINIQFEGF